MIKLILNDEHLGGVLAEAFSTCRHRLFIATADVKNLYIPVSGVVAGGGIETAFEAKKRTRARGGRGRRGDTARSIVDVFDELGARGIEIRLLHSGIPSGPFLERLKNGVPRSLTMRRCCRVHAKAVIVDGLRMYLGSANLTGAGLGAKSARRRNFEAGLWTDEPALIDETADMLESIWSGRECDDCGRKANCPVPLEEPDI